MFAYSGAELANLELVHSPERLARYIADTGNMRDAMSLYVWNTAVSSAFYGPLQAVEIGLRNALHRELVALFGANWPHNSSFVSLDYVLPKKINEAKINLQRGKNPITTPRIVAALSFGFWNTLLDSGPNGVFTTKLWKPGLQNAFPNLPYGRGSAFDEVKKIREFRNRIAHHEPIYYRNLQAEYNRMKKVMGWMYNDLSSWVEYHTRCVEVMQHKPYPRQVF